MVATYFLHLHTHFTDGSLKSPTGSSRLIPTLITSPLSNTYKFSPITRKLSKPVHPKWIQGKASGLYMQTVLRPQMPWRSTCGPPTWHTVALAHSTANIHTQYEARSSLPAQRRINQCKRSFSAASSPPAVMYARTFYIRTWLSRWRASREPGSPRTADTFSWGALSQETSSWNHGVGHHGV
jgi:hypothetical protein